MRPEPAPLLRCRPVALIAPLSLGIALLAPRADAQYPIYEWSQGIGGTSGDDPNGIVLDDAGNFTISGTFAASVDFGGGPVSSAGSGDVFLAQYDPDGNHQWSRAFGGTGSDRAEAVSIDGSGNLAITGAFRLSANFGGASPLTSVALEDAFVAVYDAAGSHLWSRGIGGSSGDQGRGVAFDAAGNLLLTGSVRNDVDFGGGTVSAGSNVTSFLAKYAPDGTHLWSHVFTGTSTSVGTEVAADADGNVILAGQMAGTVNFGGSNLTSAGSDDTFLVKFDADGNHVWSQRYGNVNYGDCRAIVVDTAGSVFLSALIQGTVDFGGGSLPGLIGSNIVLAKYDADGNHLWSDTFGESQAADIAYGLALDASGSLYATGYFDETTDFGGGPVTNGGYHDVFIVKFDNDGVHEWSAGFGTTGAQEGRGVVVDALGRVTIVGQFANVIDLGGGLILPVGGSDIFLAQYDGGGATDAPSLPADAPATIRAAASPNPFRTATTIDLALERTEAVNVTVYDARGARVATLLDGVRSSGRHAVEWSGRGADGRVASGVYFVRYATSRESGTIKVVRMDGGAR